MLRRGACASRGMAGAHAVTAARLGAQSSEEETFSKRLFPLAHAFSLLLIFVIAANAMMGAVYGYIWRSRQELQFWLAMTVALDWIT